MKKQSSSLMDYISSLQINGRYTFTRSEALAALEITPEAFKLSALRLIKKSQLIRPKKGFYVVVPTEFQGAGAPPVAWYIDPLMKYSHQQYYVGILSAAALYGAAHQQPQTFQIITNKASRPLIIARTRLQFLTKKDIHASMFQLIKTPTGYMNVSTPEMTAIDLVRYIEQAGYLNNVITVLTELQEKLDYAHFTQLLSTEYIELPYLQRLGYLLEKAEANSSIIDLLKNWIENHRARFTVLRTDKPHVNALKSDDWRLYINEEAESDI